MSEYGYWKLNGRSLKSNIGIKIYPLAGSKTISQKIRQSSVDLHGGGQSRERLGKNSATFAIEFRFTGQGVYKWAELELVQSVLDTEDVWTLESTTRGRIFKNFSRAAFATDEITQSDLSGRGVISLSVRAILDGVWIADGGDFAHCTSGSFTLNADGTYTNNDTGISTGSTPTLELPQQTSGYPLATRASDYAEARPTLVSTRSTTGPDGTGTIYYETYSLTGFLTPAPTAAGDVGIYHICSSPNQLLLSGGGEAAFPLGIGEGSVSEYEMDGPAEEDGSAAIALVSGGVGFGSIASHPVGGP